ncbi:hypothetical protein Misp01_53860 [Microtetraspora sp. NBRC 13810]|nr:hypothetical protein Misp01_53860 [Microtetraspora sp. NBRC 13810]
MFAALGYDGISLGQIAEAAGLDVAAVNDLVGGKRELYLTVLDRLYRAKWQLLLKVVEGARENPEVSAYTLHRLADGYLDFCLVHPEAARLSTQRILSDASDVGEVERQYIQPQNTLILDGLALAVATGHVDATVDLEFLLWSIVWSIHDFCQGGILDDQGVRVSDPCTTDRFRAHLHRLIHRTMALPGPHPGPHPALTPENPMPHP